MNELFLDIEGTGLEMMNGDRVTSIAYAVGDGPIKHVFIGHDSPQEFVDLCNTSPVLVAHGIKFDCHALRTINIDISDKPLDCTLVREQLIDEHKLTYDLDSLTGMKVDIVQKLAAMFGGQTTKNVQMPNLHRAPRAFIEKYATGDINALRTLYRRQEGHLPEVHELERQVLNVLIKMEQLGMRVDLDRAKRAIKDVEILIAKSQNDLDREVGKRDVNVNSAPQMRDLLVATEMRDGRLVPKRLGKPKYMVVGKGDKAIEVDVGSKYILIDGTIAGCSTKTGECSLNAETLEEMVHPLAEKILAIRRYKKIHDTFLISQLQGNQIKGRVHPWFNQTRVVTGRLSCTNPNMQAVPKRDPEMRGILRPLFLPDDGKTLCKCDYDQSDVRGFAHYIALSARDPNHPVLKAYAKNPDTDFHTFVADMLGIQRNPSKGGGANAKQINLAMIFNMGPGKLAKQMGLPFHEEVNEKTGKVYLKPGSEAIAISELYHSRIPGAADMGKTAASVAASRGHVISIAGRHLRFPDKRFAYKASGYLYQSFTADLIKAAMVETTKIVIPHISVHDELLFSIEHKEQAWAIQEAMQTGILKWLHTEIPIRTKPEIGQNWNDVEELKR